MTAKIMLLAACLGTLGAPALAESESLYAKGVLELHAGQLREAVEHFDRVLAVEPGHLDALYYRGVARFRLGEFEAAAQDLLAVHRSRPDSPQVALDLGMTLVQAGRAAEAVQPLQRAQESPEHRAEASFFLALAQRRLGQDDAARENLLRASDHPKLRLASSYYRGVIAYEKGSWSEAEAEFSEVVASKPDSEMGREAAKFLQALRTARSARRFVPYGSLAFQYDSNVALTPSDDAVGDIIEAVTGISDESDGRALLNAGLAYFPWRSEGGQVAIGYEFARSLHFDLSQFDLEDHRAQVDARLHRGAFGGGLLAHYDYYRLDDDRFLQEITALPWLSLRGGRHWRSEVSYQMRRRDFLEEPFNGIRDAYNHAVAVRQYYHFGSTARYVFVGYQLDREEPRNDSPPPGTTVDPDEFAYDGHEFDSGGGWTLPHAIAVEGRYVYRRESYDRASGGRTDKAHYITAVVRKQMFRWMELSAGYFGTINTSSNLSFDYQRHIASVSMGFRF